MLSIHFWFYITSYKLRLIMISVCIIKTHKMRSRTIFRPHNVGKTWDNVNVLQECYYTTRNQHNCCSDFCCGKIFTTITIITFAQKAHKKRETQKNLKYFKLVIYLISVCVGYYSIETQFKFITVLTAVISYNNHSIHSQFLS